MLMAGLDGIQSDLPVPEPYEEDLYHLDETRRKRLTAMPGSLGEAIEELRRSDLVRAALGDHLFESYIEAKTQEWDEYRVNVSEWELNRYLPIY